MSFVRRTAALTLVAFLPLALGCSSSASDAEQAPAAEQAEGGPALDIVGAAGTSRRPITQEEIDSVTGSSVEFRVDGLPTTDFAKVLTAQRVDIETGNGRTHTLLRSGNRLELSGSTAGVGVEIDGSKFTIVSDSGRWECLLAGFDATTQSKMAGAMALGVLLALDDSLRAAASEEQAAGEEGRCEVACVTVIAFAIVVGAGILAATAAFIVCETAGQSICESKATRECRNKGGVRSVKKKCDVVLNAKGIFKDGVLTFKGECDVRCNR